jgi:hypothetical protein
MTGLLSMLPRDPDLDRAVQRRIVEPRTATIVSRWSAPKGAVKIDSGRDLDTLALVVQAMTTYRLIVTGKQIDRQFLTSLIKEVLAPPSGR